MWQNEARRRTALAKGLEILHTMADYTCPSCQEAFSFPAGTPATHARCPHCEKTVELPQSPASRWYYAREKKKHGPYTWNQLVELAFNGEVRPEDMLLQEGTKQWIRARTMTALFGKPIPRAEKADAVPELDKPEAPRRRKASEASRPASSFRWLVAGTGGVGLGLVIGLSIVLAWYFTREPGTVPPQVTQDKANDERKKPDDPAPEKKVEPSRQALDARDKKPPVENKKSAQAPMTDQLLAQLNRFRKSAGLGPVVLDPDLSRGCQAHAQYLAKNIEPSKANGASLRDETPETPGYSHEGKAAAQAALFQVGNPDLFLARWMGKLSPRAALLSPETHRVGIGLAQSSAGPWFGVLDAARGRGEPIVVFPAPQQKHVMQAYSGSSELPEAKAPAGFPITVSFPLGKSIANAHIELADAKGALLEGWRWMPDKPLRPGDKNNTLAFVPKSVLQSGSLYHVKSSAEIEGKPWRLAWSFTTDDDSDADDVWAKHALAKINAHRAHAGLKPVVLDPAMRAACFKHARYLVINEGHPSLQGLKAHDEDLSLPGASKEGHETGTKSVIAIGDYQPLDGLDSWMATLYHRIPLLEPGLTRIGFACMRGRRQGWVTVLDVTTGSAPERPHAVYYPAAEQVNVPLHFPAGGEEPNPIPDDKDGRAGFPVTASFASAEPLRGASGKLTDDEGKEVPCWFSSPEKLANPDQPVRQRNTVCLIPKDPLAAQTTYHVYLKGTLAGKAWEKKWKFTTGEAGLSVEAARTLAIERLNTYRAQAGLAAVVLDDKLTVGCQRHALYLVQNSAVLRKSNGSVNEEDPLLPGFSDEGRNAARQSFVFSDAPTPLMQIDDLMANLSNRVYLLNPNLERVGYGCSLEVGRGWRCVLDVHGGIGDSRVILCPAPKQIEVPCLGFDALADVKGELGFPITMSFPPRTILNKAQALLRDTKGETVPIRVVAPEKPLPKSLDRPTIAVHPLAPLQPGRTYEVTIEAVVNGVLTRQTWQFTTAAR